MTTKNALLDNERFNIGDLGSSFVYKLINHFIWQMKSNIVKVCSD